MNARPIMVLNDEGHHAYRPAPVEEQLSAAQKNERQDATIWITGLDRMNAACGVRFWRRSLRHADLHSRQRAPGGYPLPVARQRFRIGGRH